MIDLCTKSNFDFELIPVDEYWNTGKQRELKMHKIHAYPAKFPAFITTKAIDYYENETGRKPLKIGDIFCGCGTTAFEARQNNIDFWGCDINPVATMIAKVKSTNYSTKNIERYYTEIICLYKRGEKFNYFNNASERLMYWYKATQYNDLYRLKKSILEVIPEKSKYRLFFLCAFSNILKATSKWLTKSIKPQVDPYKREMEVLTAFSEQIKNMIVANNELVEGIESKTIIKTGNVIENSWNLTKVDLIITSPPYVTSYEYADLHQLSSLWLDFAEDYRDLREGTIGSQHHDYDFEKEIKRLNKIGFRIVALLMDQHKSKAKSVAKYFLDMQKVANKSFEMLNENGLALFVIGNTEYKNVRINNAKHLVESLFSSGFSNVNITKRKISNKILTPYRDSRGKFTKQDVGRKVYSEEFIVIGRK